MRHKFSFGNREQSRREFLKTTAAAASAISLSGVSYAESKSSVAILFDPDDDKLVKEPPVQWAIDQLRDALAIRGPSPRINPNEPRSFAERIIVATRPARLVRAYLGDEYTSVHDVEESFGLIRAFPHVRALTGSKSSLLACSYDVRGLVYATLELADRVRLAPNPLADLRSIKTIIQKPANKIRSIARPFNSDIEDKRWF